MLPGIDDGAPDMATSLEMARIAVSDGIRVTACTPHIYPGLYANTADGIAWPPSMHYAANSRRPMSGCS
jgi:protein-tyrosine phosphatase